MGIEPMSEGWDDLAGCHHSRGRHYSWNEGSRRRSRASRQVDRIHQLE
jgi:hypothetical protein